MELASRAGGNPAAVDGVIECDSTRERRWRQPHFRRNVIRGHGRLARSRLRLSKRCILPSRKREENLAPLTTTSSTDSAASQLALQAPATKTSASSANQFSTGASAYSM